MESLLESQDSGIWNAKLISVLIKFSVSLYIRCNHCDASILVWQKQESEIKHDLTHGKN